MPGLVRDETPEQYHQRVAWLLAAAHEQAAEMEAAYLMCQLIGEIIKQAADGRVSPAQVQTLIKCSSGLFDIDLPRVRQLYRWTKAEQESKR